MGEPDVFNLYFNRDSVGLGANFSWYGGVFQISVTFLFFGLQIFCAKTENNKWF